MEKEVVKQTQRRKVKSKVKKPKDLSKWYFTKCRKSAKHYCFCKLLCENKPFNCYYCINPQEFCNIKGFYHQYGIDGVDVVKKRTLCEKCYYSFIELPYQTKQNYSNRAFNPKDKELWIMSPTIKLNLEKCIVCCNEACNNKVVGDIVTVEYAYMMYSVYPNHTLCLGCYNNRIYESDAFHHNCSCGFSYP